MVMGTLSPQSIVERGKQLFKHPICWIRHRLVPGQISVIPPTAVSNTGVDESRPSDDPTGAVVCDDTANESTSSVHCTGNHLGSGEKNIRTSDTFKLDAAVDLFGDPQEIDFDHRKQDSRIWNMEAVRLVDSKSKVPETKDDPHDDDGWLDLDEELLITQDTSRISPKIFLRIPRRIEAIQEEVSDLTPRGPTGLPSLAAVSLSGERFGKLPNAFTTMAVKRKKPIPIQSSHLYKRRSVGRKAWIFNKCADNGSSSSQDINSNVVNLEMVCCDRGHISSFFTKQFDYSLASDINFPARLCFLSLERRGSSRLQNQIGQEYTCIPHNEALIRREHCAFAVAHET